MEEEFYASHINAVHFPQYASQQEAAQKNLQRAIQSSRWMSLTAFVQNGQIYYARSTENFPKGDAGKVRRMIADDLQRIKN